MIKNTLCVLITACATASIAVAAPPTSDPVQLTPAQMDMVTAGSIANVNVDATASSGFIAYANTTSIAMVTGSDPRQSAAGGFSGVAGGGAVAVANGPNASMTTVVNPAVQIDGSTIYNFMVAGHVQGSIVEINSAITVQYGTYFTRPF